MSSSMASFGRRNVLWLMTAGVFTMTGAARAATLGDLLKAGLDKVGGTGKSGEAAQAAYKLEKLKQILKNMASLSPVWTYDKGKKEGVKLSDESGTGDCSTLVGLFIQAAAAAKVDGVTKAGYTKDCEWFQTPQGKIIGDNRPGTGNAHNGKFWIWKSHYWATFDGKVFDVLFGKFYESEAEMKAKWIMAPRATWRLGPAGNPTPGVDARCVEDSEGATFGKLLCKPATPPTGSPDKKALAKYFLNQYTCEALPEMAPAASGSKAASGPKPADTKKPAAAPKKK